MPTVQQKIEASRNDLLDLGLRNPLISFRSNVRSIEVIEEKSVETYRILVLDMKEMAFAALPKSAETALAAGTAPDDTKGEDGQANEDSVDTDAPALEVEEDWAVIFGDGEDQEANGGGTAARHLDTKLQTRLEDEALTARLINIHSTARTYLEEQGVNVLYIAVGFLHWFEAESSEKARKAPLVLLPVELRRKDVQQRFKVAWTGSEAGDNLSLKEKLKAEFGITLPTFSADSEPNIAAYLEEVSEAVSSQNRWRVAPDEICLGFFSFGKFLMYHDLDLEKWPDKSKALGHEVLNALLGTGFRSDPSPFSEDTLLDEMVTADEVHAVVDADSTQTLALLDVASGRSMRIEGPPGTGKSQTITNLIADAMGKGRRVLFVAEKMAALEVVKRRLDKVQLGDAVLELHSHKANKKAVLEELRRTWELGKPSVQAADDDIDQLTRTRNGLNSYCNAVNEPVDATGVSPIVALGRTLALAAEGPLATRFDFAEMKSWTSADYRERRSTVEDLAKKLAQMGKPVDNPFWGSTIKLLSPMEHGTLRQVILDAATSAERIISASTSLSSQTGLAPSRNVDDVRALCRASARAIEAPHDLSAVDLRSGEWQARRDDIRALLDAGEKRAGLLEAHAGVLIPEAWDQDLLEVREALVTCSSSWWRRLTGRFRRARARLRGLSRDELPADRSLWLQRVDAVLEARRLKTEIERFELLGQALFRAQWQGVSSDWAVLRRLSAWVVDFYREVGDGALPAGLVDFLAGSPSLVALRPQFEETSAALTAFERLTADIATRLSTAIGQGPSAGAGFVLAGSDLATAPQRLRDFASRLDELGWLADFNRLQDELRGLGLPTIAERATGWPDSSDELVRTFDRTWFHGIFERAFASRPALQEFDRISHEQKIVNFRRLDIDLQQHTRARLMLQHWESLPRAGGEGEVGILQREWNKRRGLFPIRRLMHEAGRAVQAVKPVFMMSPLSVATFLPPDALEFDLVVFDEASQVKPVDAIGAILRGKQTVVVGDTKQLPPTNFFDQISGNPNENEANITADQESVLGLFAAQGAPARMLRWHYRSRHESLIAVSNQEFYDSRLVVFPAAGYESEARGLVFHHLPSTEYGRGGARSNKGEATAVAEAVLRHAKDFPHLTLGVAAFSVAQRDAIEMQLEDLRRRDGTCEAFFNSHVHEPFFVKNLENVQGDERDVILISIGYGKTKDGYLAMSFGPLNRDGGERRLNVLITRARLSCEVFCNFTADDLDLKRSQARGVAALKQFLAYAKDRRLFLPTSTGRSPDSPFEEQVIRSITSAGLDPEPQVGCAGFFIDIGIRDTDQPGRYILGVECDGASYHSARSARDRDRLREAVLRGLGWEIHRIWSSDWFRSPKKEVARLLEAVESAKLAHRRRSARTSPSKPAAAPASEIQRTEVSKTEETEATSPGIPYRKATPTVRLGGQQLHEVDALRLAEWVNAVVELEGPVASLEVARRITEAAGLARAGNRIQSAVEGGIAASVASGKVRQSGRFLWPAGMSEPPIRDRSALDPQDKRLELVCDEEIAVATFDSVSSSFTISRDDAVLGALRRLGFQRVSADMRSRCDGVLDASIRSGRLAESGGRVRVP